MVTRWICPGILILALGASAQFGGAQEAPAQNSATPAAGSGSAATTKPVAKSTHHAKRTKKQAAEVPPPPPPPPPTPEQSPAAAPVVSYQQGQLTIRSDNSTLSSILNAVQSSTGATVDAPGSTASDRIATQIGPGDPRDVLSTLLNNSKYDFILLGAPGNPTAVQKIILTARASGTPPTSAAAAQPAAKFQTQGQTPADPDQELPDSETPDDANQPEQPPPAGEGEQNEQLNLQPPAPGSSQPNAPGEGEQGNPNQPKSPEQLLQELQRMQQQQQQQQQQQPPNETPD